MPEPQRIAPEEKPTKMIPQSDEIDWEEQDVHPAKVDLPQPDTVPQPKREAA